MRLKDKNAIVTGGASGFGAGIVRKFITEGAQVMVADINGDAAEKLADELGPAAVAQRPLSLLRVRSLTQSRPGKFQ